ncbi:hypothetical protein ES705_19744 [subsurface metagenome]
MEIKDEKGQETQDKGTEEKIYTQKEHDGVIRDVQGERTKRQDAEFKFSQSQAQLASLIKEKEELKRSAEEKETKKSVIEGEDGDILTKKDGRDIEAKVVTSIEKAQKIVKERDEKERLEANYQKSIRAAITRYAGRKDIGLDFETVRVAALGRIGGRRYKEMDIYTSDNPGEELYQEGLKDPEMKEKLKLVKNEEILDAMGNRKVDKKGLTGETKQYGFHFYTVDEVAAMKPEEALKVKPDIDKSMEKW